MYRRVMSSPSSAPVMLFQRFRIFQDVGSLRVREGLSERPLQIGPKPKNAHPFGREGTTPHHYM